MRMSPWIAWEPWMLACMGRRFRPRPLTGMPRIRIIPKSVCLQIISWAPITVLSMIQAMGLACLKFTSQSQRRWDTKLRRRYESRTRQQLVFSLPQMDRVQSLRRIRGGMLVSSPSIMGWMTPLQFHNWSPITANMSTLNFLHTKKTVGWQSRVKRSTKESRQTTSTQTPLS